MLVSNPGLNSACACSTRITGAWITRHIQLTDRPLAAHLLNRGWDPIRDNLI